METASDIVMAKEYEFDINENEVIDGLGKPMRFVGYASIVFGLLALIPAFLVFASFQGMLMLFEGISLLAIGGWLLGAANAFRAVVVTEGADISNLMIALRKLRSVYTLQAWLMAIACLFVAIDLVLVFKH
jgi:hypothetical protein